MAYFYDLRSHGSDGELVHLDDELVDLEAYANDVGQVVIRLNVSQEEPDSPEIFILATPLSAVSKE